MLAFKSSVLNRATPAPRNVQGAGQEVGKLHGSMEVQHVQRCVCQVWWQSQGAEQRGYRRNQAAVPLNFTYTGTIANRTGCIHGTDTAPLTATPSLQHVFVAPSARAAYMTQTMPPSAAPTLQQGLRWRRGRGTPARRCASSGPLGMCWWRAHASL